MIHETISNEASLIVVSPAFNEAGGIEDLLKEVQAAMDPSVTLRSLHIVIVDDGSSDDTCGAVVRAATKLRVALDLVKLSKNFGQQAAIHAGLVHASQIS